MLDSKISRRTAVGTGAAVGAAVAGLVIGGAGGYLAHGEGGTVTSTTTVGSGSGATSTVTSVSTSTVTSTGSGGTGPYTGSIVVQTLAGGGDAWAKYVAEQYNSTHPGANVTTNPIP